MKLALLLMLTLVNPPRCRAEPPTVRDEQLKFSVTLPGEFVSLPAVSRPVGFPHFFTTDTERPEAAILLGIKRGGFTSDAGVVLREEIALFRTTAPGAELIQERWKSLQLDALRYVGADDDRITRVHFTTLLPVKPEAVMLVVSGPSTREAEVRERFRAILDGFEAEPWPIEPAAPVKLPPDRFILKNKHLVLLALILVAAMALGWMWLRRRRASR